MVQLNNHYGHGVFHPFWELELAKPVNHITFLMRCKSSDLIPKGLVLTYILVMFHVLNLCQKIIQYSYNFPVFVLTGHAKKVHGVMISLP